MGRFVFAEVLPILLAVIQEHRDAASRDTLTHTLFNLVKKPNAGQRQIIVGACAELASRIGPSRTAEELLPQAWEQVPVHATSLVRMQLALAGKGKPRASCSSVQCH